MNRPRPVLIFGIVVAVLGVVAESADAADLLPDRVLPWVRLSLSVAVAVGGAVWAQSKVTPLSDPRTRDGKPAVLVSVDRYAEATGQQITDADDADSAEAARLRQARRDARERRTTRLDRG